MSIWRISHSPDTVIVDLGTEVHPHIELLLWLIRLVNVLCNLALHKSASMIDRGVNDTVLNRLGDNVLRVLFRVQMELVADVTEGNAGVGESDCSESSFNDEMA